MIMHTYSIKVDESITTSLIIVKSMKGKSVAEKIASLRHIPENMLPSTLKHNIVVPKLAELKLEYSTTAKEFGPMYSFYRKYIADLRYHNPSLKLIR